MVDIARIEQRGIWTPPSGTPASDISHDSYLGATSAEAPLVSDSCNIIISNSFMFCTNEKNMFYVLHMRITRFRFMGK